VSRRAGTNATVDLRKTGLIDARAIVSPEAELARDVSVGAYAIIDADVVIGAGTTIAPHAVINGPTRIGVRNRIFQFASIGSDPQDKKYSGERSYLEIGDHNVFREFCTVNRGTANDQSVTRIGSHNLFMAYTHVAHDCVLGDHIVMANCATLAGHVRLGDWVHMGGLSAAHQFCKVGAHAFIANNTAVTRDVPPFVMAVGQPAEPHSVNAEGMRRRGFSAEQIRNVRNAFRILYQSDLKLIEAVERLQVIAVAQPEVRVFVDFIGTSTRSLVR
jgi:UDP-N-acetylglucosamine acyltransferase